MDDSKEKSVTDEDESVNLSDEEMKIEENEVVRSSSTSNVTTPMLRKLGLRRGNPVDMELVNQEMEAKRLGTTTELEVLR